MATHYYLALCAGYEFKRLEGPYSEASIKMMAHGFDEAGELASEAMLICWQLPEHEAEMTAWDGEAAAEAIAEMKRRNFEYCGQCCRRNERCECVTQTERCA